MQEFHSIEEVKNFQMKPFTNEKESKINKCLENYNNENV
jgi:hypothetical protein